MALQESICVEVPGEIIATRRTIQDFDTILCNPALPVVDGALPPPIKSRPNSSHDGARRELEKEAMARGFNALEEVNVVHTSDRGVHWYVASGVPKLVGRIVSKPPNQNGKRTKVVTGADINARVLDITMIRYAESEEWDASAKKRKRLFAIGTPIGAILLLSAFLGPLQGNFSGPAAGLVEFLNNYNLAFHFPFLAGAAGAALLGCSVVLRDNRSTICALTDFDHSQLKGPLRGMFDKKFLSDGGWLAVNGCEEPFLKYAKPLSGNK